MKKKLITLAKELDFTTESEYFDYLIDCHTNGNFSQCKRLFEEMRKEDQKRLLIFIDDTFFTDKKVYNFYFGLL